jgi:hypothetical protein
MLMRLIAEKRLNHSRFLTIFEGASAGNARRASKDIHRLPAPFRRLTILPIGLRRILTKTASG